MPNRGRKIAAKKALLGKKKKSKRPSIKSPANDISEDLSFSSNQIDTSPAPVNPPQKRGYVSTPATDSKSAITPSHKGLSKAVSLKTSVKSSKTITKSSTQDTVYHYIRPELQRIGICSGIVLGLLIILSFVLT